MAETPACSVNAHAQTCVPRTESIFGSPAGASTARLGVTQDDNRHLQIVAVISLPETFRNAVTVIRVAILAHLPLALEPRDRKMEPDDASQHRIDIARGSFSC